MRSVLAILFCVAAAPVPAQEAVELKPPPFGNRLTPPNDWQFTARTPLPMPAAEPERTFRLAREAYADKSGTQSPLDELQEKGFGWGGISCSGRPLGAPADAAGDTILVGTFRDYDVVFTSARTSIYTEIHIEVEQVMSAGGLLAAGDHITILRLGGTIFAPRGRVLRYGLHPLSSDIRPQQRYLLFLRYVAAGNYYSHRNWTELPDGQRARRSQPTAASR
jgi:hypothetical protein